MDPSSLGYFPVDWPILLGLAVLLGVIAVSVMRGLLRLASASMGIRPGTMLLVLLLALLGSYINIPVAYLPAREVTTDSLVYYYGIPYVIPVVREWPGTVVAVNVGGALIPTVLSLYMISRNRLLGPSVLGVAIVALVCHLLARPIPGLGIAEPVFAPPAITAAVALLISRRNAGPLAYIAGSLGTLIGADLMNLNRIQGLGAPVASIGGAGTFDGIFLTGLIAVLCAGLAPTLGPQHRSAGVAGH